MKHVPIADLARAIAPWEGGRIIAVLYVYLDASNTEISGPRISSVAGYLAPLDDWQAVEAEWDKALVDWKLKRFHLSHLVRDVGRERAQACLGYFRRIIESSDLMAIGSAVFNDDWWRQDWGEDTTVRLDSPYEQCLDLVLKAIGNATGKEFQGEKVAIVCDLDAPENIIFGAFCRRRKDYPQFTTATIGSSYDVIPLQCADLGAGLLRKSWLEIVCDKDSDLPFGALPKGRRRGATSVWSLRQGAVIRRTIAKMLASSNPAPPSDDPSGEQ